MTGNLWADQNSADKAGSQVQENTLKSRLDSLREANEAQTPPEMKVIGLRQQEALLKDRVAETALQVGAKAPEFSLPDAYGKAVNSADLLKSGPVIVTFYRGSWCPYCNLTLHELQQSLTAFEAEGATLVAISPEQPDLELETVKQHGLLFPVLSDHGLKVAKEFGVVYDLTPELDSLMTGFGVDMAAHNGAAKPELPLGATYVIDQQGIIRYAFLSVDYTKRAEPADILAALRRIKKS
jgi:peroxiredoxin